MNVIQIFSFGKQSYLEIAQKAYVEQVVTHSLNGLLGVYINKYSHIPIATEIQIQQLHIAMQSSYYKALVVEAA